MPEDDFEVCDKCGAIVYPEQLETGKAASLAGKLMCTHCLTEYKATHHANAPRVVGQTTMKAPGEGEELATIAFDEDTPLSTSGTNMPAQSPESSLEMTAQYDDSIYRRPLVAGGKVATRCRTFHARLNDGALNFMNRQINEWVDTNPDIAIKFAASTVGVFEGKKAEAALIVTVFY